MASLRERLQVAREANASLRAELTALNKRTKKVEGRITRVQSLVDKAQTSGPQPAVLLCDSLSFCTLPFKHPVTPSVFIIWSRVVV